MHFIQRVAVLGAGTMGARIAAHFANAGIPSLLLDVTAAQAKSGLDSAIKQKPAAFFTASSHALVTTGGFDDDLPKIAGAEWIIEAVTEKLDVKRSLWQRILQHANPAAILSTNTSGIPLAQISEGFSAEAHARFLGTHFFNPPRYLHLLEVIPGPATKLELLAFVEDFAQRRLGKGTVRCKDTPNFIANRIGSFFGGTVAKIAIEDSYSVEEVDALTGSLIGLPNSASFRLLDIVGIDIWAFVGSNLHDLVPHDPWRERFLPPPFLAEMLKRGMLGEKSGQGFYRRVGKDRTIEAIDWRTLEYHPANNVSFPSADAARNIENLPERLRFLVAQDDRAGQFLWKLFRDHMVYAAERVPEISDNFADIDRAMRWGYAHKFGPFELWDALGFEQTAQRIEADGSQVPDWVKERTSFYPPQPARAHVRTNPGASVRDLGDGVFCVEFHSKMNTIGEDTVLMLRAGLDETARNGRALVIGNQGADFCVGANLMLVLMASLNQEWDELDQAIRRFQTTCQLLKSFPLPVVCAPFNRTLGGGTEIALHCARIQASAETYMGLVELGVGLVPAGGGCKEMLLRLNDPRRAFEIIGMAKVSASAAEARELGFLTQADGITMNPDRLIDDAKALALSLTANYARPVPRPIAAGGESMYAQLKLGAWMMHQGGYITDYDLVLAEKLARILSTGGEVQHILDLEREAFLSLCGDARTQARMQHMLKTGKPLRN